MSVVSAVAPGRLVDWEFRLDALVRQAHREPFAWGRRDCCLWAADATWALTGMDPAADVRGTYDDERGALRVLQRLGGLCAVAARGGAPIRPAFAIDGDVGLVQWQETELLAVRVGEVWLAVSRTGLIAAPADAAVGAWGVGHA